MKKYDLILVVTNFRRSGSYLSIVKYLAPQCKIGLLRMPIEKRHKTSRADELFLKLLQKSGAWIIQPGEQVSTQIMILPQWTYTPAMVDFIKNSIITSKKNICLFALTWAGIHDDYLAALDIHDIFLIDKNLFSFLLETSALQFSFRGNIIETGLPYAKYPVFESVGLMNYVIAIPTPYSFPTECVKISFLRNVLSLADSIYKNSSARIVLKPHNAVWYNYFIGQRGLDTIPSKFGVMASAIMTWLKIRKDTTSREINSLYKELSGKTVDMKDLTPYWELPLEIFLPHVSQGIIGGLSNTAWGTLFFNKAFYNCVPDNVINDLKDNLTLKKSLEYFGVPCCNGELEFDLSHFSKIAEETRSADLIEILRSYLING